MSTGHPSSPTNPLAGIVAIAILLLILGLVAGLLISRAAPPAAAPLPTIPAAPPTAAPTSAPPSASGSPSVMPTATTYRYDSPPPMTIDPAKKYTATIYTPRGEIVIELLPDIAPQTVNNFVFLARQNFYNGLTWHRVLPDFMAQGGDPNGDGTGGPGYTIPAEFTDQILFDQPGIVAMARSSDPNSAGSQFFITTAPAPWLNEQYTIFGRVIQGQDIVNGIPLRDPSNPADLATPGETILGITINEE
ncbi:peptidylprolyl isomerase [Chloroflexus sp.]|uniref:peptidylprolyl isomerase n=1 Tax=Chloroflexus sp. TaxID=1904827 RepID=UPI002636B21D|nr:peptidylprolyl isomerase [uncultured Chloroflexus sp.]